MMNNLQSELNSEVALLQQNEERSKKIGFRLREGDPCWVRIKGKGKPILAEYHKQLAAVKRVHMVSVNGVKYAARYTDNRENYFGDDCIFVLKPIPENARELLCQN